MQNKRKALISTEIIFDSSSLIFNTIRSVVDEKDHSGVSLLASDQMNSIADHSVEKVVNGLLKGKVEEENMRNFILKSQEKLERNAEIVKPHIDAFAFRKIPQSFKFSLADIHWFSRKQ